MIPILALRAVMLAALAAVQGLSVVSDGDRTAVLVEVEGEVSFQHQLLQSPPRIVLDVSGAEFRLPARRFLDINRGGVLALRSSQFEPGVVRVVVDLAESVDYEVEKVGDLIRISFRNTTGPFQDWHSETMEAARQVETPAPQRPAERMLGEPIRTGVQPADAPGRPVEVSRPPVVEAPQETEQPRITITFRNTPILDVLGLFADQFGRSIVPGQGVSNQVITGEIVDQPWDQALAAILQGQGLVAREGPSGIITVTTQAQVAQQQQAEPLVTETYDLQYVSVDSIQPQLQALLAQGEGAAAGNVTVSRATNSLIVRAPRSVQSQIAGVLAVADRPVPQVTIQARIIFVDRTALEGLGFRYEIKDSRGTMLNSVVEGFRDLDGDGIFEADEVTDETVVFFGGATIAAAGNAVARLPKSTLDLVTTLVLGRHSLITFIEALQELNLTDVQAEPVVQVMDHRNARVQVGERTPIRVVDQGAAAGTGPQASVRTEETGVILDVVPHVIGNQVRLELHAERSNVAAAPADIGFTFQTQQTDTEILLNDGQTAVISGLTIFQTSVTRTGIPFLMDLPLVGALFRSTSEREQKQDLLIMVTPFIERDSG